MTVFLDHDPREEGMTSEEKVGAYLQDQDYPFEAEYRFHDGSFCKRKINWRFDFANPEWKLAFEVEGQIWHKGGHSSGHGILRDMKKYNTAALMGWVVIRIPTDWVKDGSYKELVDMAVKIFSERELK